METIIINQWVKLKPQSEWIINHKDFEEQRLLDYLNNTVIKKCGIYHVLNKELCLVTVYDGSYNDFIIRIENLIKDDEDKRIIPIEAHNILNDLHINFKFLSVSKRERNSAINKNYEIFLGMFFIGFINDELDMVGITLPVFNRKRNTIIPLQMIQNMKDFGASSSWSTNNTPDIMENRISHEWTVHKDSSTLDTEYNTTW